MFKMHLHIVINPDTQRHIFRIICKYLCFVQHLHTQVEGALEQDLMTSLLYPANLKVAQKPNLLLELKFERILVGLQALSILDSSLFPSVLGQLVQNMSEGPMVLPKLLKYRFENEIYMNLHNHYFYISVITFKNLNNALPDPPANPPFTEVDVVGGLVSASSSLSSSSSVCPT